MPTVIELHADLERRLPAADPDGTEMRLACGAALFNLRIAMLGAGIRPTVTLLPDPDQPQLIAAVRHGGHKPLAPEIERLLRAVPQRHTNRHPFSDVAVATSEQYAPRRAALDERAWLHIVTELGQRASMRGLAAQAHQTQMADAAFRDELCTWTGNTDERDDGVPAAAGGPYPELHDRWVMRNFSAGHASTRLPGKDFEADPLVAVLTSHLIGRTADVEAGQALQRVLLTAAADGVSVSYLSQIVEVPATRDALRRLIDSDRPPQVVLRMGHGWPVPATPRRQIADLLLPVPFRFRSRAIVAPSGHESVDAGLSAHDGISTNQRVPPVRRSAPTATHPSVRQRPQPRRAVWDASPLIRQGHAGRRSRHEHQHASVPGPARRTTATCG